MEKKEENPGTPNLIYLRLDGNVNMAFSQAGQTPFLTAFKIISICKRKHACLRMSSVSIATKICGF